MQRRIYHEKSDPGRISIIISNYSILLFSLRMMSARGGFLLQYT